MPGKTWKRVHRSDILRIKKTWLDTAVKVIFGCFMIIALAKIALDGSPGSQFLRTDMSAVQSTSGIYIHSLSVFLLGFLFLFFWLHALNQTPYLSRVLLTVAFTVIGYAIYDTFWSLGFLFNLKPIATQWFTLTPSTDFQRILIERLLWLGIPSAIILSFRIKRSRYLPMVMGKKRFVLILILNLLVILWLSSTGFYQDFELEVYLNSIGMTLLQPHGWVWFAGKVVGMLSWLLVFIDLGRVKTRLAGRLTHIKLQRFL
jgi:glucan phosphoethanolaminetransferase (alkaline phosphatase superfamily)